MSITSERNFHQKEKECGIALLLLNEEGDIFCVRELIAKPEIGKGAGDYSFPWETQEEGESDEVTLNRLIREEVHAESIQISEPCFLGEYQVMKHAIARAYLAYVLESPLHFRGLHGGKEIEPLGWRNKDFLLSKCRKGVREALLLLEQHQVKEKSLIKVELADSVDNSDLPETKKRVTLRK